MKTNGNATRNVILAIGITVLSITLYGCEKDATSSSTNQLSPTKEILQNYAYTDTVPYADCNVNTLPIEPLSDAEVNALTFLREEELLAHDVYVALSQLYTRPIFANISRSEQRHTDAISTLLTRYNVTDPAANHVEGTFSNQDLQTLYNALVAQGTNSLLDGLIVGATIEDLDIHDLQQKLTVVDNQDIIQVFNNLMRGSRNHLRSFYSNILSLGGSYTPQYITQEEFDQIVNSEHEAGPGK